MQVFSLTILCSLLSKIANSNKTNAFYLILTEFTHDLIESWIASLISPQMNCNRKKEAFSGMSQSSVKSYGVSQYKMLFILQNYTKIELG